MNEDARLLNDLLWVAEQDARWAAEERFAATHHVDEDGDE